MSELLLPPEFSILLKHEAWILPTERERLRLRLSLDIESITQFYDAMKPHIERALEFLNTKKTSELTQPEYNLLLLTFSYVEAAFAVENYHAPDGPHGFPVDAMISCNDSYGFKR